MSAIREWLSGHWLLMLSAVGFIAAAIVSGLLIRECHERKRQEALNAVERSAGRAEAKEESAAAIGAAVEPLEKIAEAARERATLIREEAAKKVQDGRDDSASKILDDLRGVW